MAREDKREEFLFWEFSVAGMDVFDIPGDFKASIELNKYDRFTGYVEELIARKIKGATGFNQFNNIIINKGSFPRNWWNTAIKVADGKKVNHPIPSISDPTDGEKKIVYESVIPAYRAVKESFENRRWYEWIFNHSQYVAERDTIKALSGLMTSLIGATQKDIDAALEEHINVVPDSGMSAEERKENIESVRRERIALIKGLRAERLRGDNQIIDVLSEVDKENAKPLFSEDEREVMDGDLGLGDGYFGEEIENIENLDAELDMGKEQVVFENNEFAEFDNLSDDIEPIAKSDEVFIEKADYTVGL